MNDQPVVAESTARDRRHGRLDMRVTTMSTCPDQHARFRRRRTEDSTGTARRHWAEHCYAAVHPRSSTFLRPFAPDPLPVLLRSYGRSDSCSPGSSAFFRHEHRLGDEQVSLIHAPGLPALPSPTTCGCFPSSGHVTPRRVEPRLLPHEAALYGDSGLRPSLAGSPHRTGRIEFLIVRTGRSPPAAPHPVSPRRSRSRLQVTLTWRGLSPLQPGALSGALARASCPLSRERPAPVGARAGCPRPSGRDARATKAVRQSIS